MSFPVRGNRPAPPSSMPFSSEIQRNDSNRPQNGAIDIMAQQEQSNGMNPLQQQQQPNELILSFKKYYEKFLQMNFINGLRELENGSHNYIEAADKLMHELEELSNTLQNTLDSFAKQHDKNVTEIKGAVKRCENEKKKIVTDLASGNGNTASIMISLIKLENEIKLQRDGGRQYDKYYEDAAILLEDYQKNVVCLQEKVVSMLGDEDRETLLIRGWVTDGSRAAASGGNDGHFAESEATADGNDDGSEEEMDVSEEDIHSEDMDNGKSSDVGEDC